jgi:C4-dicarboxylate-specific signal transduction histidine kinase
MIENLQRQFQITILPAPSIGGSLKLKETDLNEVVRTVEGALPQYVNEGIDVTITLLEKNLKLMADMAHMREILPNLIKNTLDAVTGSGRFSLTVNQINFDIESLSNGANSIIGACAFICLTDTDRGIDEKLKEKMFEPFFTTKTDGNGLNLAIAYRIIKQCQGGIRAEGQAGQGTEINVYVPLNKSEIVNMMSIPLGASYGRIH